MANPIPEISYEEARAAGARVQAQVVQIPLIKSIT
jgi:hypothetical protein